VDRGNSAKYSYAVGVWGVPLFFRVGTDFEIHGKELVNFTGWQKRHEYFMKHIEILASFFSTQGLRDEGSGLAIVACALLTGGLFIWRVTRFLKRQDAEDLERERHRENAP
jgi:hypothetical protein